MIIGGSGPGKISPLLNLIGHQIDINKIYLYTKDPYEVTYHLLTKKRGDTDLKHYNFVKYPINTAYVYKNVEEYNPDREREVFNVFHLMIADMINKC